MYQLVNASFSFLSPTEKRKWLLLTALRSVTSVLDLVAILGMGLMASSTAAFLAEGSDKNRTIELGSVSLPAINAQTLPLFALAMLMIFILKAVVSISLIRFTALLNAKIEARAAKVIAENVFGYDLMSTRVRSRDDVIFAIQAGSPAAFNSLLGSAATIVSEGALFFMILIGFAIVDPIVTLAAILWFSIVAVLIQFVLGSGMARESRKLATHTVTSNVAVSDMTKVFRELLVARRRGPYIDRIYEGRWAATSSSASQTYLASLPRYIIETALILGAAFLIGMLAIGGDLVSSALTLGVFLSGGVRLTAAMLPLQGAVLNISGVSGSAATAHHLLSLREGHSLGGEREEEKHNWLVGPYEVELTDVSFGYETSEPVLKNINLNIKRGSMVGIIGPSGAGKTTLADIICGVLVPTTGSIRVSNDKETDFEPKHSGSFSIGYVPQRPEVVSGSLAENVALGQNSNEIDRAQVVRCLDQVLLSDFVSSLPDGIDTSLSEHQRSMSGGQIQRLGLARALYFNPGLLVLDEATSALDAETEFSIQQILQGLRTKCTVVTIAHRLHTMQICDKVVLLGGGNIIAEGTLHELVRDNDDVRRAAELFGMGSS